MLHILIVLAMAFDRAVLFGNAVFSIIVLSNKKRYSSFLKKVFVFQKVCFKVNPLSAKFIKWSNTLKQFVGKLPTNCLSVFDHFLGLPLKGLNY